MILRRNPPRQLSRNSRAGTGALQGGILPNAHDALLARDKLLGLYNVSRGVHIGVARAHELVDNERTVNFQRIRFHEVEVRFHAVGNGYLVELQGLARRECHIQTALAALDRLDLLTELERNALFDQAFLESFSRRRQRIEIQHVRIDSHESYGLAMVQARFEHLERHHGRSADEHALARRVFELVLQTLRALQRAQHERLVALIAFNAREAPAHRRGTRSDDALRVCILPLCRANDMRIRVKLYDSLPYDVEIQLIKLV